jgi:ATP-binding cassette subfamily B (MDR/TAP) protein 1
MQDSNPMNTPIDKSLSLSRDMCPKTLEKKKSRVPYASVVGSLRYAMICSRPNICYVIELVSQYQSNSSRKH